MPLKFCLSSFFCLGDLRRGGFSFFFSVDVVVVVVVAAATDAITDVFWDIARAIDGFDGINCVDGGSAFNACAVLSLSCHIDPLLGLPLML